jgi:hypothetical protein
MRRSILILCSSISAAAIGSAVHAQMFDDDRVCSILPKPGLYYVYAGPDASLTAHLVADTQLSYRVNSRFYYKPRVQVDLSEPGDEGVWHIRTQTSAAAAPRANMAYVYRPPVVSRCSNGQPLYAFSPNDRLFDFNRFVDYHAKNRNGRERDSGLRDFFHFEMQDPQTGKCGIRTDDANALGSLEDIYAFRDVKRDDTLTAFESTTSFSTPAFAMTSKYQGLTSEFAYRTTAGSSCVSFSPPLPTGPVPRGWFATAESAAIDAAAVWKPKTTSIVLKRFRGRKVMELVSKSIGWDQQ